MCPEKRFQIESIFPARGLRESQIIKANPARFGHQNKDFWMMCIYCAKDFHPLRPIKVMLAVRSVEHVTYERTRDFYLIGGTASV